MQFVFNDPYIKPLRKDLRARQTPEEKILWQELRNKKFRKTKFYRQYSVGRYILDFYCPKYKLAVELDGRPHRDKTRVIYDRVRTQQLGELSIKVLRFWNYEIHENLNGVLSEIKKDLHPY
jgi:very-short-patch-repair endonuclease